MPLFTPLGIDGGQQRGPNNFDWPNYTAIQARLTRGTAQAIASSTTAFTAVSWSSSMNGIGVGSPAWSDTTGLTCWDSATPTRLLLPITGWWAIGFHARVTVNARAIAQVELVSGATRANIVRDITTNDDMAASTIYPCGAGEYLELMVQQQSGSSQSLFSSPGSTPCLWAYLIGQI